MSYDATTAARVCRMLSGRRVTVLEIHAQSEFWVKRRDIQWEPYPFSSYWYAFLWRPAAEASGGSVVMTIAPWHATCMQMPSWRVTGTRGRAAAWTIIRDNLDRAVRMIGEVLANPATADSRLLLFPEFAFQRPPLSERTAEWIETACDTIPGEISRPLQTAARECGVYIGANHFEIDPEWPGRFFNCSFLIDPRGAVILKCRRIYTAQWPSPHDFLDAYLARYGIEGTFPVADTDLGKLAMFPCGEIGVPEAARMFMLRGAEVPLHPDNAVTGAAVDAVKVARAYENMLYLISTNVAGPIGFAGPEGTPLGGRSAIVDYHGAVLALAAGPEPSTPTAVMDIERLREARRDTSMRNRLMRLRFEIYRQMYESAVLYPANQFAETPMRDWRETEGIVQRALDNLVRRGIAVEEPARTAGQ